MGRRGRQIAVIGSGSCSQDSELAGLAKEVGRRLAEARAVVVCGGLGGVMEAASRGAAGAGGTVIGIVPSDSLEHANPHCTHVVATGIGHARNLAVVASGEAVIAVGGEWGTLSEIGFARRLGREVATLRSWQARGEGTMEKMPGVTVTESPEEAVSAALGSLDAA
ncbi:MAG: TIGR00725 family protein [Solirubrobacterales bacterium]